MRRGKEPGKAITKGWGQGVRVLLFWSLPRKYQNLFTSSGSTSITIIQQQAMDRVAGVSVISKEQKVIDSLS
jgi:hypothetical protein